MSRIAKFANPILVNYGYLPFRSHYKRNAAYPNRIIELPAKKNGSIILVKFKQIRRR